MFHYNFFCNEISVRSKIIKVSLKYPAIETFLETLMSNTDIDDLIKVLKNLKSIDYKFEQIVSNVLEVIRQGGTLFFCGNGGSSAEAQHQATEYLGVLERTNVRKGIKAISLVNNPVFLTAWSNDFSFDSIFSRQLETLASENDLLFVYTTSGNSKNCIEAIKKANALKIPTICFTGSNGGYVKSIASISVLVPSKKTARIQEVHLLLGHSICEEVEKRLVRKM